MRTLLLILASVAAWGQAFSGGVQDSVPYPLSFAWLNGAGGLQTWATLNNATIKGSHCGFLSTTGGATKTAQNLHIMLGAVTKTSGSDLRIGLQAASTSAGPPIQPDGTWLASGAAYATVADADITANTWLRSGTVGGSLSMTQGGLYCLVVEPENYAGSDSFLIRSINVRSPWSAQAASYNGSSWTAGGVALHLIEFTDGTFGTLGLGAPFNAVGSAVNFNSASTPDEIALGITPTSPLVVQGMCADNPYGASADFEWVLYEGTTPLETVASDANTMYTTTITSTACVLFDELRTLATGTRYNAALKPTTTNSIRLNYSTAADAAYFSVVGGAANVTYASRTDGGAWSDTDTRRPHIWLLISGAGSTGGGGGGGAYVVAQ